MFCDKADLIDYQYRSEMLSQINLLIELFRQSGIPQRSNIQCKVHIITEKFNKFVHLMHCVFTYIRKIPFLLGIVTCLWISNFYSLILKIGSKNLIKFHSIQHIHKFFDRFPISLCLHFTVILPRKHRNSHCILPRRRTRFCLNAFLFVCINTSFILVYFRNNGLKY